MTADAAVASHFDMGRVASRTFGVIGRNFVVFAVLAAVLAGIPQGLAGYFIRGAVFGGGGANTVLAALCSGLISMIARSVLQASLIHGAIADLNGRKASFGDCLSTGLRFLLPVIAITLLTSLALAVGFVLLIVPGVLMALAWCVNVPVVVVERKGVFDTFGRSADLTRNHRGAIVVLMIAYFLVAGAIQQAGMGLTGGLTLASLTSTGFNPPQWILLTVLGIVESLVAAAGIASIYYELRSTKEGIGPEALASVFD